MMRVLDLGVRVLGLGVIGEGQVKVGARYRPIYHN